MKLKIVLALVALNFLGCTDDSLAPTARIDDMTDDAAVLIYEGSFVNGPYGNVVGTAKVFKNEDDTYEVKLDEFNTSNGPDLYVYLSQEAMPVNFISLGKLKSTNGNQIYSIPGNPDFSLYKFICIHCKEYNHLFGYAEVE
jgi:hypothetical protein